MNIDGAIKVGETLFELAKLVYKAIAKGQPERVDAILPVALRTTLAKALADAQAEERFAAAREAVAGTSGDGHE